MASSWLFRPLPLRERVGRGVAPVSSTLRTRRLVVPSPPHPNPLPRGEREPEVPSAKGVIANSTVLALGSVIRAWRNCRASAPARVDSPADRRRAGPRHRRPGRRQAGRGDCPAQSVATAATAGRSPRPGHAQEHYADWPDRGGQDRNRPPAGHTRGRTVCEDRGHQVHRGRLLWPRRREPDSRPGRGSGSAGAKRRARNRGGTGEAAGRAAVARPALALAPAHELERGRLTANRRGRRTAPAVAREDEESAARRRA